MNQGERNKSRPIDEPRVKSYVDIEAGRFFKDTVEKIRFVDHYSFPLEEGVNVEIDVYGVRLTNYGEVFATDIEILDPDDPQIHKGPSAIISEHKFPDAETAGKSHACIMLKLWLPSDPENLTIVDEFAGKIMLPEEFRYYRQ